jgi:hypothetical protein
LVVSTVAVQEIVTVPTPEFVVSTATMESIVAVATDQFIVSVSPNKSVIAISAVQVVVTAVALEVVIPTETPSANGDSGDVTYETVIPSSSLELEPPNPAGRVRPLLGTG